MKEFPFDFETKKPLEFFPEKPDSFQADILEIGPGRGDVLYSLAGTYPQKKIIAIEIGKKRFAKFVERLPKRQLSNVLVIRGDARVVIPQFFKSSTFEQILVLFPDPWPKDKHAFRRLLNKNFLELLSHLLKPQGILITATDVPWYAQWISENLDQIPCLTNALKPHPYVEHLEELPETYFEKKWKSQKKELFFLKYQKTTMVDQPRG